MIKIVTVEFKIIFRIEDVIKVSLDFDYMPADTNHASGIFFDIRRA